MGQHIYTSWLLGTEEDGLSSYSVFRLNFPPLFLSFWTWILFIAILCTLFKGPMKYRVKTGENRPAEAVAIGCVSREYFAACVSCFSFPCSHLTYFQTDPLQCTDCFSKTTLGVVAALLCECCWLLLPKCCASPCWHQNVPHSPSQHISPIFKGIFITNPVVQWIGSSFQHSVITNYHPSSRSSSVVSPTRPKRPTFAEQHGIHPTHCPQAIFFLIVRNFIVQRLKNRCCGMAAVGQGEANIQDQFCHAGV